MRRHRSFAHFVLASLLVAVCATQAQQSPSASPPPAPATAIRPPEHPVTEEQLRTFFNVCHVASVSVPLTHEKMELQRKQLPPWYPQPVWDAIEDAIDKIDLPKVGLPVYQKYLSQDDAKLLIRFMATPQGQKLTQTVLARDASAQRAGVAPITAREQVMAQLATNERAEVDRIVSGMSPKDLKDLDANYAHLQQLQPILTHLRAEYAAAIEEKQKEVIAAVVAEHRSEILKAQQASHAQ